MTEDRTPAKGITVSVSDGVNAITVLGVDEQTSLAEIAKDARVLLTALATANDVGDENSARRGR